MVTSQNLAYDVAIVGGGPAGLIAATLLAPNLRVLILERSEYDDFRPGEILSPPTVVELKRILCRPLPSEIVLESPGIVSLWGTRQPQEQDFIFSPHGFGWMIARPAIDIALANAAEEAGATLLSGATVTGVTAVHDRHRVVGKHARGTFEAESRFVLHANGRSASRTNRPHKRKNIDNRVVLLSYLQRLKNCHAEDDLRLLIEAEPSGWWYSAILPNEQIVFGCVCDTGCLPTRKMLGDYFMARLEATRLTRERYLRECQGLPNLSVVPASSYLGDPLIGPGWLRIGQAAASFDPLSGLGWSFAIRSAKAAVTALQKGQECFPIYEKWAQLQFSRFVKGLHAAYFRPAEQFDSPFWNRATDLGRPRNGS